MPPQATPEHMHDIKLHFASLLPKLLRVYLAGLELRVNRVTTSSGPAPRARDFQSGARAGTDSTPLTWCILSASLPPLTICPDSRACAMINRPRTPWSNVDTADIEENDT